MADTSEQTRSASELLQQCHAVLGGMEHRLSDVVRAREQDFLSLGENLMELQSGCEDISAKARELVELASGQSMVATLDNLSGELRALTDQDAHGSGQQSLDDIDNVSRIVDALSEIVSAFGKIVKQLSMLGIATRIESARLGAEGRGFSTLADDVEKLAHSIVDHCAGIISRIATLRGHVASARQRTLGSIKAQRGCYDTISGQLAANLSSLGEVSARSAELSQELAANATEIAADIGQAVKSIQFHDIVRQQIEHVEHALTELAATLDVDASGEENPLELVEFTADVLGLQTSQLDSAGQHFSEAAATLRQRLDSLAGRIEDIGHSIASLSGHVGDTKDSPLAGVQSGIALVKSELGEFAGQGEALGGIMDSVAGTIAEMGQSIEAIEEVGSEIELIALNASIKAAHTGQAGAALSVLATAIQRLSADARRQTDAVTRILGDISNASKALQETARRYNDQSEAWGVIGELDTVLADVAETESQCDGLFAVLSQASAEFGSRARLVGRGIDFDKDLVQNLTRIRDALAEQVEQAHRIAPVGAAGRGSRLQELYDRYTMDAERAVHEAAFGLAADSEAAEGPVQAIPEETGEFGGNVELF